MSLRPQILPLLGALVLGALAWLALRPTPAPAAWLTVEAPRSAATDRPLTVRVTPTAKTPPGLMIKVDLHWTTTHDEHRGVLSGAPAQAFTGTTSPLVFSLAVPARPELGSVRAVIFAGPTARWNDRVAAVTSDPIKIATTSELSTADTALHPLPVFDQRPDPAVVRPDSRWLQGLITLIWVAAGVFCWRQRSQSQPAHQVGEVVKTSWRLPAIGCLLAAGWEILPMETLIGGFARDHFVAQRWYGGRAGLQLALTTLLVAAAFWLSLKIWHHAADRARRLTWLGLGLYATLALTSLLSLHEVDVWLAKPILSGTLLQLGQLATAALTLIAGASPRRHPK